MRARGWASWPDRVVSTAVVWLSRALFGVRARWVGGRPDDRARVYYANHASHLDFVVVWAALPAGTRTLTRPVAAGDYWGKTRLRRYLTGRVFRAVLVERQAASVGEGVRVEAARRTVERAAETLGAGCSLILFPEGTRGGGGDVARFKSGLYHLCRRRPGLELVPTYLANLDRILPKGAVLPVPLLGSVTFGSPLHLEPGEEKDAFLTRVRGALLELRRR